MCNKPQRVDSITHLRQILTKGEGEFFVLLNKYVKTTKTIYYDDDTGKYHVENRIGDSDQELTEEEIMSEEHTIIGKAITKGAFFFVEYISIYGQE